MGRRLRVELELLQHKAKYCTVFKVCYAVYLLFYHVGPIEVKLSFARATSLQLVSKDNTVHHPHMWGRAGSQKGNVGIYLIIKLNLSFADWKYKLTSRGQTIWHCELRSLNHNSLISRKNPKTMSNKEKHFCEIDSCLHMHTFLCKLGCFLQL